VKLTQDLTDCINSVCCSCQFICFLQFLCKSFGQLFSGILQLSQMSKCKGKGKLKCEVFKFKLIMARTGKTETGQRGENHRKEREIYCYITSCCYCSRVATCPVSYGTSLISCQNQVSHFMHHCPI
jgi:hypothetical protein